MIIAGIDIGAATAKTVILDDDRIRSCAIMPTGFDVRQVSLDVMKAALEKAGALMGSVEFVVSTGYGRRSVPFMNKAVTEIICHAKGANYLNPQVRTVIDIGGQDSKVIRVDEKGNVVDFIMNDKCAAGTGRFLEVMATVLQLDISEMGSISLTSKAPCQISSTCTVFAETEMVSLRAEQKRREDLVAGIHKAVALRIANLGARVGYRDEVILTGGVSKNIGMKKSLEDAIGIEIMIPEEPQIIGALGAALLAKNELSKH